MGGGWGGGRRGEEGRGVRGGEGGGRAGGGGRRVTGVDGGTGGYVSIILVNRSKAPQHL